MANGAKAGMTARARRSATAIGMAVMVLGLAACGGEAPAAPTTLPASVAGGDGTAGATAASALLGEWRLLSQRPAGASLQPVPAGTLFTAAFGADGRVSSVVDCNRCSGGYTADAETLAVSPMACTRAYCAASAGYDSTFEKLLASARRWKVQGNSLELTSDAGTMQFAR